MRLETRSANLPLDPDLEAHVERRIGAAVGRLGSRLRRVAVQLVDVNGPRGGVDIRCRIQGFSDRADPLVVEALAVDPYTAVSRAADRFGRSTVRRIQRKRTRRRAVGSPR